MMPHGMAFCLSAKVVALHLDNSTAKTYLCNQGGTVSPFLSRLVCWTLSLTDKHSITLIPAYIHTHLNVDADYLSWGWLLLEWHLLPKMAQAALCLWVYQGGSAGILPYHSVPVLLHLGNLTTSGGLGVECLQPSLDVSGKLYVSSSCIGPCSSVHIPDRRCQRSNQTFDSDGTMLDGGSLASHSSQHIGRHSSVLSHHKRSCHGCFGRPCAQGSDIYAFNPLAAQRCMLCRQGSLPQSVRQWWGQFDLHQRSTNSVGRNGHVAVLERVYQTMPYLPLY